MNLASLKMNESSGFESSEFESSGFLVWDDPMLERSKLNTSRWEIAPDIHGPVIATCVSLMFVLALSANLFIVAHTIVNGRRCSMKNSTFLLFILSFTNLLMAILYMPFYIISSSAGAWIFGHTDIVRSILCQMQGFVFVFLMVASIHTLAVISIDRFLNIVKPHVHKKYMNWKVSLGIMAILWVIDVLVSAAPYYNPVVGRYGWSRRVGGCSPLFNGYRLYVLLQSLHALIPLMIIAITSCWTFVFTRGFLKRHLRQQKGIVNPTTFEEQKHVYSGQVKNLIGIFGSLLLFNFIAWTPFLGISAAGFGIGFRNIPNAVYASAYVLFLFSNVFNPIIQMYFRKDLIESFKKIFCRWRTGKIELYFVKWCRREPYASDSSDETKAQNEVEVRQVKLKDGSGNVGFESVVTFLEDSMSLDDSRLEKLQVIDEKMEPMFCDMEDRLKNGEEVKVVHESPGSDVLTDKADDAIAQIITLITVDKTVSNDLQQKQVQLELQQVC